MSEYGYTRSDPVPPAEYGGGGSSGANYYDSRVDFDNDDFSGAISHARHERRAARADTDDDDDERESSFFSEAISFLKQNRGRFTGSDNDDDLDDRRIIGAHQSLYGGGGGGGGGEGGSSHDANSLGMGAALQALKLFTSSSGAENPGQGGGGSAKDKLIGLAMAQAGKLWEEKQEGGNVVSTFFFFHLPLYPKLTCENKRTGTSNPPSTPPRRWR
ncbi:hypothetical protein VTN02DRAFT_2708 [Thermoascus thermophilus]